MKMLKYLAFVKCSSVCDYFRHYFILVYPPSFQCQKKKEKLLLHYCFSGFPSSPAPTPRLRLASVKKWCTRCQRNIETYKFSQEHSFVCHSHKSTLKLCYCTTTANGLIWNAGYLYGNENISQLQVFYEYFTISWGCIEYITLSDVHNSQYIFLYPTPSELCSPSPNSRNTEQKRVKKFSELRHFV